VNNRSGVVSVLDVVLDVRDLGRRWGTHRPAGEDGPGAGFWRLLGTAMPEYETRRGELDELGRRMWMRRIDAVTGRAD
jgi:hypothetical protein